tara:strand:+ start:27245 stop:28909 length:1665 start_codon:yes stop_codon:yes gene_type:complete
LVGLGLVSVVYFILLRGISFWFPGKEKGVLAETRAVLLVLSVLAIFLYGWHFFAPSSAFLILPLMLVSLYGWWKKGGEWIARARRGFRKMTKAEGFIGVLVFGLPLLFAAQVSTVADEGLYYAQSILWFEEVGWVKGLANFDYFLGQGSALHALESLLHFQFGNWRSNDVAAFLVALASLELYLQRKMVGEWGVWIFIGGSYLMAGLFTAPNTDIIYLVLIPVLFFQSKTSTWQMVLLVGLAALTKLNGLIFCILLLGTFKQNVRPSLLGTLGILFLVFFKSWWLTGYPLFPFSASLAWPVAWQIPAASFSMQEQFGLLQSSDSLGALPSEWGNYFLQTALLQGKMGIDSIFTYVFLVLSLLVAWGFVRGKEKNIIWAVFIVSFAILWLLFAPQIRLALPMLIFSLLLVFRRIKLPFDLYYYPLLFAFVLTISLFGKGSSLLYPQIRSWSTLIIPKNVWNEEHIACSTRTVDNLNFKKAAKGSFCYYACFPCQGHIFQDYLVEDSLYVAFPLGDDYSAGFSYRAVAFDKELLKEFNSWDYVRQRGYLGVDVLER